MIKKIIGAMVIFIGGLVALVMWLTSGMTDVANDFFTQIKSNQYKDAYKLTSSGFKNATSFDAFTHFITINNLNQYKDSSWSDRSITGRVGELKGTVTLKNRDVIPLTLKFVKNDDEKWKIVSIHKNKTGISTNNDAQEQSNKQGVKLSKINAIPSENKLISLVQDTTQIFKKSLSNQDMQTLYDNISQTWQKQITVIKLNEAFMPILQSNLDFTKVSETNPIIDNAKLDNKNFELQVWGHYPTSPIPIYFRHSYVKEYNKFKLLGLNINSKPIE